PERLLLCLCIPAGGRTDRVALPDWNVNDVVDGIREFPVKARFEKLPGAGSERAAKAQFDGDLVWLDGKDAREDEGNDERAHQQFDHVKTAAQGFGQGLSAGVFSPLGRPGPGWPRAGMCRVVVHVLLSGWAAAGVACRAIQQI